MICVIWDEELIFEISTYFQKGILIFTYFFAGEKFKFLNVIISIKLQNSF